MDKLKKVNDALRCLYKLIMLVGTFDEKEKDLFCSYIEYLDKENECKKTINNMKEGEKNANDTITRKSKS